jgi:XTP/dITP diphosphohydrolase
MKLVFATNNQNKIKEIQQLVPSTIKLLSLTDIKCFEEIEETGLTLQENAIIKANYVTKNYGYNCFADDTGLEVDFLKGKPGVYSARYAGEDNNAENNMQKLLAELSGVEDRKAKFRTVIALNLNKKQTLFKGICNGNILKTKQGEKGFGYDPIFMPKGFDNSFAEMTLAEKGKISHRGKAVNQLIEFLNKIYFE